MGMLRRSSILAFGYLGLLPECEPELPRRSPGSGRTRGCGSSSIREGIPAATPGCCARSCRSWTFSSRATRRRRRSREEDPRTDRRGMPQGRSAQAWWGSNSVPGGVIVTTTVGSAYIPARRVRKVVDATGAGDAFVAGFLAATIRGSDPFGAARFGKRRGRKLRHRDRRFHGDPPLRRVPADQEQSRTRTDPMIPTYHIVSHSHWDREWYKTFEQFRSHAGGDGG